MTFIFTKKHYINLISALIVWLGGTLFIVKIFDTPELKIIFYSTAFFIAVILIEWAAKYCSSLLTKKFIFLAMLLITAVLFLVYSLKYIGYLPFTGLTILWLVIIHQSQNIKVSLLQLAVFFLSPIFCSEMISFSGVFTLSMLVLVLILFAENFLDPRFDWKYFLTAILFGVTLPSTILVGFIYIIYLLYAFRNNLTSGAIFVLIILIVHALLLLLADRGYLLVLSLQNNFSFDSLPVWVMMPLGITTLYVGWIVSDMQEVLFSSGVILFMLFTLSFLFKIIQFGWNKNEVDISILILAIPFLILSIKDYKVDRFLGKVTE